MRRPWTRRETRTLKDNYQRKGPGWCAQRLNRTQGAICSKASKLGLGDSTPPGYVRLTEVDPRMGNQNAQKRAINLARTANVLESMPSRGGKAFIVPEWWADRYAEQLAAQTDLKQKTRAWLTTREVADMFGVHRRTVTMLTRKNVGIGKHLQHVERVKFTSPNLEWRFHPDQVRLAVRNARRNR